MRNELPDGRAAVPRERSKMEAVVVEAIRTPLAVHVVRHEDGCAARAAA